ncbi:MAG: TrkH family potassium uptake protein [Kiritimatiellae bacterium]|nr:TrkH family potassium uptake protein [Kiritimatiellia bacterium]
MAFSFLRILTYVLGLVGTSLLLPLGIAIWKDETSAIPAFLVPMLSGWGVAITFWLRAHSRPRVFDVQHAFGTVGGIWIAICLFGALPLYFSGCFPSFTDAVFESVSGFTTTGASVLSDVERLPISVNLWRCETHWLGGLGVIALAVALIPLLGIGGFRLIKAETTGPDKAKLTSLIANTAKMLWFIYMTLTAVQAFLLWHVGMEAVDALAHAFSTMGTGGFSTRNASVGAFGLPTAEWICTAFMLLASVNFTLYYRVLTGRFGEVSRDSELRTLLALVFCAVAFATAVECSSWSEIGTTLRSVAFQVASIISTTGFMTDDYLTWRPAAQVVIFILFFVGGSSGSTAGGIKVIRWTILGKQLRNELRRILHPHEVFTLSINGCSGREAFVPVVASFVFVYMLLVLATTLAGALAGLDVFTAFTGALSMVGNVGPAFGGLGPTSNYGALAAPLKWFYMFAMLAGRLEIYTLLILVGRTCFLRNHALFCRTSEKSSEGRHVCFSSGRERARSYELDPHSCGHEDRACIETAVKVGSTEDK